LGADTLFKALALRGVCRDERTVLGAACKEGREQKEWHETAHRNLV